MLTILDHIRMLLLSAAKRYSPVCLLQYLLALCRRVFKRCRLKCSDENLSHKFPLPKTPTIAEGNGCLSEESIGTPVGHAISGSYPPAQPQGPVSAVEVHNTQNNAIFISQYRCKPPLKQGWQCVWTKGSGLINMVFFLDHPGFIHRSLAGTQGKDSILGTYTDVEKWRKFSKTYAEDTSNISLLGTVLLGANVSFLAIQSIDKTNGFSLPQKFSYLSLLVALASIVMGLAVRSPRLFTNYGPLYFEAMRLILGFPFELFLFSVLFFLLALLTHCAENGAHFQLFSAVISGLLVLSCLVTYWLITEPRNDVDTSPQQHQVGYYASPSVQGSSHHLLPPQIV